MGRGMSKSKGLPQNHKEKYLPYNPTSLSKCKKTQKHFMICLAIHGHFGEITGKGTMARKAFSHAALHLRPGCWRCSRHFPQLNHRMLSETQPDWTLGAWASDTWVSIPALPCGTHTIPLISHLRHCTAFLTQVLSITSDRHNTKARCTHINLYIHTYNILPMVYYLMSTCLELWIYSHIYVIMSVIIMLIYKHYNDRHLMDNKRHI